MQVNAMLGRVRKNITIGDRRTSIMLEQRFWAGLIDICRREQVDLDTMCTRIDERRPVGESLSSAIRVVSLMYFQMKTERAEATATDDGQAAPAGQPGAMLERVLADYAGS